MRYLFCVLLVLLGGRGEAQIITTVGGGGTISSDGVPATSARILDPGQPTFDFNGNFIFPQNQGQKISKIDIGGIIRTIGGTGSPGYTGDGGPATLAKVKFPNSVAIDSSNNIYICDVNNHRIRRIENLTGIITTVAGNGSSGFSGDGGPATLAMLNLPSGICLDKKGNVFVSDGSRRVRKIDNTGTITTIAGIGLSGVSGDGGPATAARCGAGALCLDKIGNLYIADCSSGESRIAKIDTFGIITTYAGTSTAYLFNGDGIPATTANINPIGMVFDDFDNLYFADQYNNRVRKIDPFGLISTVAGNGIQGFSGDGGPATNAELDWPEGIAMDNCGNLYIAEVGNARIRKVTYPPVYTTPTISLSGAVSGPAGTTVTVTATVASAGSSYIVHWLNHGLEFTTTTVPSVTYTKPPGIDTITARIVPTGWGCWDSTVSAGHIVVEGPTGNVLISQCANMQIWPNPAGDVLYISGDLAAYRIISIVGAVLQQGTATPGTTRIPLGILPTGTYFLEATTTTGQKMVRRVVKE